MKTVILVAAALILTIALYAQNESAASRFVAKYSERGMQSFGKQEPTLIGKPLPAFYFSKELNSKALHGKCIVLDFWATWCGGCLLLSHDLDSLMIKSTEAYHNVQIIGVNCKEKMIDKGYNAGDYWERTKKGFPMVDGPVADSCGTSVKNGFPTVILVDDKGIVRGRWDAWTPSTANAVRIATWEFAILPKVKNMPVTIENAKLLMTQKDWVSALYLFELLPESDATSLLRMEAMLYVSEEHAAGYAATLKEKWAGSPKNDSLLYSLSKFIVQSQTDQPSLINTGLRICEVLKRKKEYANAYEFWGNYAQLNWRLAQLDKQTAFRMAEQSYRMAEQDGADRATLDRLKKNKETYERNK